MAEKQEQQELTPDNWEEWFRKLANPNCNKCYGRGFVGWVETPKGRMPKGCGAKGCSLHKFKLLQIQARRQQMQEEAKKRKTKEVENDEG